MNFSQFKAVFAAVSVSFVVNFSAFSNTPSTTIEKQFSALEAASGGRIGVSAINTQNNQKIEYHADERFAFDCTAKVMVVAAILKKSMADPELLEEKIHYKKQDLIEWSPITEKHLSDGMTIAQLCEAAIIISDNTAVNLLLKKLGGPKAVNAFARSIGDTTFNLNNWWPKDANWIWGDVKDTSTPVAMRKSLQTLTLGDVLATPQRTQLLTWLKSNTTGNERIREGVPKGWVVGDKTGTNFHYGAMGDIAIIWPPKCKPILLAIYYKKDEKYAKKQQDVIASATRIVLDGFASDDHCLHIAK